MKELERETRTIRIDDWVDRPFIARADLLYPIDPMSVFAEALDSENAFEELDSIVADALQLARRAHAIGEMLRALAWLHEDSAGWIDIEVIESVTYERDDGRKMTLFWRDEDEE